MFLPTLFISDLHLCQEKPESAQIFLDFLAHRANQASALYILGDLFDYWIGDDMLTLPFYQQIAQALKQLDTTRKFLMYGNRDFLLGEQFLQSTGIELIEDPTLIEIDGHRILLTHGDTLCTDDVDYQTLRQQIRTPAFRQHFLAASFNVRQAQAEQLRAQSEIAKQGKYQASMDINQDALVHLLRQHHHPSLLIHGHTHLPAEHVLQDNQQETRRWVLGSWDETPDCLVLGNGMISRERLAKLA